MSKRRASSSEVLNGCGSGNAKGTLSSTIDPPHLLKPAKVMPSGGLVQNPEEPVTYLQDRIIFEYLIIHFCKQVYKKIRWEPWQATGALSLTGQGNKRRVIFEENFRERL